MQKRCNYFENVQIFVMPIKFELDELINFAHFDNSGKTPELQ